MMSFVSSRNDRRPDSQQLVRQWTVLRLLAERCLIPGCTKLREPALGSLGALRRAPSFELAVLEVAPKRRLVVSVLEVVVEGLLFDELMVLHAKDATERD
jgi:hypothetical protein